MRFQKAPLYLGTAVLIIAAALLLSFAVDRLYVDSANYPMSAPRDPNADPANISGRLLTTPAFMGIMAPAEYVKPDQVELLPTDRVISVSVGDSKRAYPLKFMSTQGSHIVNECFDGTPLTVAYCDETDVARVLTSADQSKPLDIIQQGLLNGELALFYKGKPYQLSVDTIPLDSYAHVIMSWSEWQEEHPDGLVYSGVDWEKVENENRE